MLLMGLWLIWGYSSWFSSSHTWQQRYKKSGVWFMMPPLWKHNGFSLCWGEISSAGENCSSGTNWDTDICWTFRWRPEIDLLVGQLAVMSSGNQVKKAPVKTTQPKEFSLTKPKPASVPVPELIPLQEKCKPVGWWAKNGVFTARGSMQTIQRGMVL